MIKIALARRGRVHYPFYSIQVADASSPRDGRFIEKLGTYDPKTKPGTLDIKVERVLYWLTKGAQPTATVHNLCTTAGVMLVRHLIEGIQKGATTKEIAQDRLAKWEALIAKRRAPKLVFPEPLPLSTIIKNVPDVALSTLVAKKPTIRKATPKKRIQKTHKRTAASGV